MTDDRMQPNADDLPGPDVNGQPKEAQSEQVGEQPLQSQANAAVQPGKRAAPPRIPLFRH